MILSSQNYKFNLKFVIELERFRILYIIMIFIQKNSKF